MLQYTAGSIAKGVGECACRDEQREDGGEESLDRRDCAFRRAGQPGLASASGRRPEPWLAGRRKAGGGPSSACPRLRLLALSIGLAFDDELVGGVLEPVDGALGA